MPLMSAENDYNSWRNTLINILSKHGKTPSNVSGWSGTVVESGEPSKSKQIDDIKNDIINSTKALCHITEISSLDVGDYSVGSPILLETKTKIEAKLTEMNNICHHDSDYGDHGDDGDNSDDSDYPGHLGGSGDCYDDANVAMYIGSGG